MLSYLQGDIISGLANTIYRPDLPLSLVPRSPTLPLHLVPSLRSVLPQPPSPASHLVSRRLQIKRRRFSLPLHPNRHLHPLQHAARLQNLEKHSGSIQIPRLTLARLLMREMVRLLWQARRSLWALQNRRSGIFSRQIMGVKRSARRTSLRISRKLIVSLLSSFYFHYCSTKRFFLVHTGEEHEKTVHQTRAKLYTMDSRDTYKERGTGLLKVNVRKSDGRGGRLGAYSISNFTALVSSLMSL